MTKGDHKAEYQAYVRYFSVNSHAIPASFEQFDFAIEALESQSGVLMQMPRSIRQAKMSKIASNMGLSPDELYAVWKWYDGVRKNGND